MSDYINSFFICVVKEIASFYLVEETTRFSLLVACEVILIG
jgi:hypothetical protein